MNDLTANLLLVVSIFLLFIGRPFGYLFTKKAILAGMMFGAGITGLVMSVYLIIGAK